MRNHILFLGAALLLAVFLFASCELLLNPIDYSGETRRLAQEIGNLGTPTPGTPQGDRHDALLTELAELYDLARNSGDIAEFYNAIMLSGILPAGMTVDAFILSLEPYLSQSNSMDPATPGNSDGGSSGSGTNYYNEARRLLQALIDSGISNSGPEQQQIFRELTELYGMAIDSNNSNEFINGIRSLSSSLPVDITADALILGLLPHVYYNKTHELAQELLNLGNVSDTNAEYQQILRELTELYTRMKDDSDIAPFIAALGDVLANEGITVIRQIIPDTGEADDVVRELQDYLSNA